MTRRVYWLWNWSSFWKNLKNNFGNRESVKNNLLRHILYLSNRWVCWAETFRKWSSDVPQLESQIWWWSNQVEFFLQKNPTTPLFCSKLLISHLIFNRFCSNLRECICLLSPVIYSQNENNRRKKVFSHFQKCGLRYRGFCDFWQKNRFLIFLSKND